MNGKIPSPLMGEGQGEGEAGTKGRGNPANPQIPAIPGSDNNALDSDNICSNITTKRRSDVHRKGALKTNNRRVATESVHPPLSAPTNTIEYCTGRGRVA